MNKGFEVKRNPKGDTKSSLPIAIKEISDEGVFTGYAAKFGNVDHGGDLIVPGAFKEFLASEDAGKVRGLWQHNWDHPIFVPTLMKEDAQGLYIEAKLVMEVQKAREALALAKAGALGGMSIGYFAEDWSYENGIRLLKKVALREFSLVTFPMNDQAVITSAKTEDLFSGVKTLADCEALLREVGEFSRTEAKTIISKVKEAIRADVDGDDLDALAAAVKNLQTTLTKG